MSRRRPIAESIDIWISRYVQPQGDCWAWGGDLSPNGYGTVHVWGRGTMAHRVFYEYFIAPIPPGLDLDHLCRVRNCVNPWHLDPVTRSVNLKRAANPKHNSSKTHCPQGHPYEGENLYITPSTGGRVCLTCNRAQGRARRDRKRLATAEGGASGG